jgi:hypothetical protein
MALRMPETPRDLVSRILETPDLARVVQSLEPSVLHRLVLRCGLEDCGPILALATTEQLVRVFDDDLWRGDGPGAEEQLDGERFSSWLEVLCEAGPDVAARRLVEMDFDFVTAAVSRQALVLDAGAMLIERLAAEGDDDQDLADQLLELMDAAVDDSLSFEVGGFKVLARRPSGWDALVSVLVALHGSQPAFFARLLVRCRGFSAEYIDDNGGLYEVLTSQAQVEADTAGDRDERRARGGHLAPPLAAAFLATARQKVASGIAPPPEDHMTGRYFRELESRHREERGAREIVRIEDPAPLPAASRVHELIALLQDDGSLPPAHVALLAPPPGASDRHARLRAFLDQERPKGAQARLLEELGYLGNVLVAGCSFQSRRFRPAEAAEAVLCACNLGLEIWPRRWSEPRDLVTVFRLAWSVLHERVCVHTAGRLIELATELATDDDEVGSQLAALARRMSAELEAGTPWRARDALDVLAILDAAWWSAVRGLVDECPVLPKPPAAEAGRAALRVSTEFEFISGIEQVERARGLVERFPAQRPGSAGAGRGRRASPRRPAAAGRTRR